MIVSVVPIGNSRGIRLPKAILDQLEVDDKLELEVENRQIILTPVQNAPRAGWEVAFQKMAEEKEDELLMPVEVDSKDFDWEW